MQPRRPLSKHPIPIPAVLTAVPVPVIIMPTPVGSDSTPVTTSGTTPVQSSAKGSTTSNTGTAPVQSVAAAVTLADLKGKIIFFSDRDGGYAQLYMMNADEQPVVVQLL